MVRLAAITALLLLVATIAHADPGDDRIMWYRLRLPSQAELNAEGFNPALYEPGALLVTGVFGYRDPKEYDPGDRIPFGGCLGVNNLLYGQVWVNAYPKRKVMALDPPLCARSRGKRTIYIYTTSTHGEPPFPPTHWTQRLAKQAGSAYQTLDEDCCVNQHDCPPAGEACQCNCPFTNIVGLAPEGCEYDGCDEGTGCQDCQDYFGGVYPNELVPGDFPEETGGDCDGPDCFEGPEEEDPPEITDCEDEDANPLACCSEGDPDSDSDGICNACDAPSAGCVDAQGDGVCDDCEADEDEDTTSGDDLAPSVCKPSQTTWCCEAEGYTDTDADGICNRCDADVQQPPGNNYCIDLAPRDGICDGCQGECNVCSKLDELIAAVRGDAIPDRYNQPQVTDFDAGQTQTNASTADVPWMEPMRFGNWDAPITEFMLTIPIPGGNDYSVDMLGLSAGAMPSSFQIALAAFRNLFRALVLGFITYRFMFAVYHLFGQL